MQTGFAGIKASATTISHGPAESSAKDSLCGFVSLVHQHTKITNSVTSANRSTSTLEITQTLTGKNGYNANNVTSGSTVTVRSKMASMT